MSMILFINDEHKAFTSLKQTLKWILALKMEIEEIWMVVVWFFNYVVLFQTHD